MVERLKRLHQWRDVFAGAVAKFGRAHDVVDVELDGIPEDWMPAPRKRLARLLLEERLRWLRALG